MISSYGQATDAYADPRLNGLKPRPGQIEVAAAQRGLLAGSAIRASDVGCDRVQDPYSFRCQPQVMGACVDLVDNAERTLLVEANATRMRSPSPRPDRRRNAPSPPW